MRQTELAAIRFGFGMGPRTGPGAGPAEAAALLASLSGPDTAAARHPMLDEAAASELHIRFGDVQRAARDGGPAEADALKAVQREAALISRGTLRNLMARILDSDSPFRDRLLVFWADHFTARAKSNRMNGYAQSYLDTTLRPHLTGRFADMLRAVAQSPLMLAYLDQNRSVGPGSRLGLRQGRGLNENLAREMLELHTLGVGGSYRQADVRQLAELLTGFDHRAQHGFQYRSNFVEPGAETVLGVTYGGDPGELSDVLEALEALAVHPDTARHIARKLAVHFVSDTPDRDLVAHVAAAFERSGGDLMQVYAALLEHPAAWAEGLEKAKPPFAYIVSALLALGMTGDELMAMRDQKFHRQLDVNMRVMGQRYLSPPGPDGWPEEAEAWITPQGLATRIRWSLQVPPRLRDPMPDARKFLETTLGGLAPDSLRRAVRGAETQTQGVALVLASPTFNRR